MRAISLATAVRLIGVVVAIVASVEATAQQIVPPAKIVGRQECQKCHVSEHVAWERSAHNTKAWGNLSHAKAAGFAEALGVTEITGATSKCTQCHGTQQGQPIVVAEGNSCESCHGGAGGPDDWLTKHADFGFGRKTEMTDLLADRAKEAADHRAARDAACRDAGMNRSADAFEIASNCLQCHLVPNEKLHAAEHPMSSGFEFVEWAQGEVRHNFLLDPKKNAEAPSNWLDRNEGSTAEGRKRLMYVAGQLADLAVSLRIRAAVTSTKRRSLGAEANSRIRDRKKDLEKLGINELKPALAAVAGMDRRSLRKIDPGDGQTYGAAADAVSTAARAFVAAHQDGSKLPVSIEIPGDVKGDVYLP